MKDSGIEWIGEIPEEWGLCRLKYFAKICNGRDYSEVAADDGDIPVIGSGGKFAYATRCLYDNESVLLGRKGTVDKPLYINEPFWTVDTMYYTEINSNVYVKYFYYLCTRIEFQYYQYGSAVPSMTQKDLNSVVFPYPNFKEQMRIADYLDRKCAEIDAVIARQEAVIEKLKDYKLSLITEAVTRGLDPNAPMKDSGVEWIGQIPEHWKVVKFGRCAMVVSNLVSPDRYEDYPQIAPDCIEKNSAKLLEVRTVRESGVISWNHLFHKGQIIYSKVRPLLNKVIIAPFDGLCSADMYPIETEENNKFLLYCILSRCFNEQVALVTMDRVKMPKINQNELSNIWMALPPTHEQREIVEYLDDKCDAIDNAVMKKQSLIDRLTSYKKSLIYEVVTGKREVSA